MAEYPKSIEDRFITTLPDPQAALDLFRGEWSSRLPDPYSNLRAGKIELFEDNRITWAAEKFGGFENRSVLELGPLEGGHTYMAIELGASSVLSIEANTRAYLKCLIIKEILSLERCRFLLGDFVEYLRTSKEHFDICLASGVLYHMIHPAELIKLIAGICDRVLLWTHYYDENLISGNGKLAEKFIDSVEIDLDGRQYQYHRQEYRDALGWDGFCGGALPHSYWMNRNDILTCMRFYGFTHFQIGNDDVNHPNGPAFSVVGLKRELSSDA